MKRFISILMVAFLFASALTLSLNVRIVRAGTIVVPDDYPTIQAAINAARDGDTVYVRSGVYYENIVVTKPITLVGEDEQATVIDGRKVQSVISVTASNVKVTGFKIQNSGREYEQAGARVEQSSDVTFLDDFFIDDSVGIWSSRCRRIMMEGNTFNDILRQGIYMEYSNDSIISNDEITNCDDSAIALAESCRNLVCNNTIANNGLGIDVSSESSMNVVRNNIINHDGLFGVFLFVANRNVISNNTITNNDRGILINDSFNNTVVNNAIAVDEGGIVWIGGSGNAFWHNSFVCNRQQVNVTQSADTWDSGYPAGGNYWSDYAGEDVYRGPYQNETGSDGIGDTPYTVGSQEKDRYPLVKPRLMYQHDLAVTVWGPPSLVKGASTTLQVVLCNLGLCNEMNVHLQLFLETAEAKSETIPQLATGSSFAFNYSWTPAAEGIYNVTAYVSPVPMEQITVNNAQTVQVNVYTPPTGTVKISIRPPKIIALVGSTVTLDVVVENVQNMFAWQISLYFNPQVLSFTAAWCPVDNVFAGETAGRIEPVLEKDETGVYVVYANALYGGEPTFYGSGVLCRLNFTVIGEGSSALHLANANKGKGYLYYDTVILDSEYNVINTLTFDGEVTTTVRADINRDLKVDIVDVAMVAGAFGSYPSSPKWNPACDVNGDKRIDIYDVAYVCHCFGWYDP